MRRPLRLQFSTRTLLIATAVIAIYFAVVFPPRLQNKHAIEVLTFKHRARFTPDGFHGPLWMRAMLKSSYTMGIDYLCYDSSAMDDSAIPEIALALKSLPSPVRQIEFLGTKVTSFGLEDLQRSLPNCKITATSKTQPNGPGTAPSPANGN